MKTKAGKLSDPTIHELSLVFAQKDGQAWGPRNEEARVLAVKGGKPDRGVVAKAIDSLKAYFMGDDDQVIGGSPYPVTEAADNIDGDGDGPEDYNQIVSAVCSLYYDLSGCYQISSDAARSSAIVACIDEFLAGLDKARAPKGDDASKSGARHSEADLERLRAVSAAAKGIGQHIEAMNGALKELGVTAAHGPVEGEQGPDEDGGPDSAVDADEDSEKAKKKDDEGKYGDVAYADEKNKKYPIDTEEHARAAWSYINQEKNADMYDADELKEIRSRIMAACKKFGIEISDDSKKAVAEQPGASSPDIAAMIAEAAKAGAAAATAELKPQIEAATATANAAREDADKARADLDEQKKLADRFAEQARNNAATLAAVGGTPTTKSALSAAVDVQQNSLAQRMQNVMRDNPVSHVI